MSAKKWARKARTIVVHLDAPEGAESRATHIIEIRDAKRRILRTKVLEYRDRAPALSAIMIDVRARLARNSLVVDEDSYELTHEGRMLNATVSVAETGRARAT